MPIYEYKCGKCGDVNEFLEGVSIDQPEVKCPACGSKQMRRKISASNFVVKTPVAAGGVRPCGAGPGERCDHCDYTE